MSVQIRNTNPTVNDDSLIGFKVGDQWLNTESDKYYILMDDSSRNAVWLEDQLTGDSALAINVVYDPTESGLTAENVQTALDEIVTLIPGDINLYVNILYSDLAALKSTNLLVIGQKYRITDHQTKHLIPNTTAIWLGTVEPLILTATSLNTFDTVVQSELFPNDIIHYNFDDNSCEDGIWSPVLQRYEGGTTRTGKIAYRQDTVRELATHYDWRNVKFRRWKVDAIAWVSGTSYLVCDVVKSSNGNIYVCKINISGTTDPSLDTVNWQLWLDIVTNPFQSWTSDNTLFNIGGITTTNLIINNITPITDYNDYYTFTITNELTNSSGIITDNTFNTAGIGYKQYSLGNIDYDSIFYSIAIIVNYNNIVFNLTPDADVEYISHSNYFDDSCFNSTIVGNYFYNNTIRSNSQGNIIGRNFQGNIIGTYFTNNTIGNNFKKNIIKNEFQNNIVSNNFNSNTIGIDFYGNKIGREFYSNAIENGFQANTIGTDFNTNTIGDRFYWNTIEDGFYNNAISNNINTLDFTLATHVYGAYDCEIFKRQDGTVLLKYMDNTNAYQFVSPTA